jgi:hypothetical protein
MRILVLGWLLFLSAVAIGNSLYGQTPRPPELLRVVSEDAQSTSGPTPPPWFIREEARGTPLAPVLIPDVPFYIWHHGCGPTSAGMVLGYWDGKGFDFLIPGNAQSQTSAVDAMIATEGPASNYTDYCLPIDSFPNLRADKSEDPPGDEHPNNCVADYMLTSQSASNNYYGWSWASDVGPAMKSYVDALGMPDCLVTQRMLRMGSTLTWDSFKAEIDAGRPMVLLVDTDGDNSTDHFVTAVGYDDGTSEYACHDTWDSNVHWYEFQGMGSGRHWGVWGGTTFRIEWICSVAAEAGAPPPPACLGEAVVLDGSGSVSAHCDSGLEFLWRDASQVLCDWQPSPVCTVLPDSTTQYTLRVRCADDQSCEDSDGVLVEVLSPPEASVGPDPLELCLGQNAELGTGPGDPGLDYLWEPADHLDDPRAANPTFAAEAVGATGYLLTVIDPATGCSSEAGLTVSVIQGVPVEHVGNRLMGVKSGDDVLLSWPSLDVRKYNLHFSTDKGALDRSNYTAPLLASPTDEETYDHAGAAVSPEPLLFYQVYGRDCDGGTIFP